MKGIIYDRLWDACHDALDFEDIPPEPPSLAGITGNANLDTLLRTMRQLGFAITEEPGWLERNPSYNWYSGAPHGIMVHHTATDSYDPERAYPEPEGSRDDGKTICNILIQPDGVLNFVSADPANYSSGQNWKPILLDYVQQRRRFHGPQSGPLGTEWYGNRAWINIETVHPGDGSTLPEAQERSLLAVIAVMCEIKGWDSTAIIGHYDGRGTKVDPRWTGEVSIPPYSIAGIQDAVQAILDGNEIPEPINPPTPPNPEPGDEFMFPMLREGDGYIDGPHPEWRGAVVAVQQMLAYHGYADTETADGTECAADGAFGHGTAQAVRAFQTAKGLTADGIVGPDTYAKLIDRRA
jgi:hypothetical protein